MHGNVRNTDKILVRKPWRKRQLRRPRHTWEHNIKVDLKRNTVWGVQLNQDRIQWWEFS